MPTRQGGFLWVNQEGILPVISLRTGRAARAALHVFVWNALYFMRLCKNSHALEERGNREINLPVTPITGCPLSAGGA